MAMLKEWPQGYSAEHQKKRNLWGNPEQGGLARYWRHEEQRKEPEGNINAR
jgi:hypothetical protein